ncbi:MAG: carboxylating nicotinate-nucleotide diphosphorylase, partial [Methylococcales bacterium]|nr:carboxylating nicotinate-nucleotide diphosphorylase [Methylococcales bacterium]
MNTIAKFQIHKDVANALSEDILTGDLTAELIPENTLLKTKIISRESAVICGLQWLTTAFLQMDEDINVQCLVTDGELVQENQTICTIDGNARSILTAERTALNFLQLLSGTATTAKKFADKIHQLNTHTIILDTRKTIPGLRLAQKYAISCGGCHNHRKGLYDALLIKENHIQACGSITQAIVSAKNRYPDKTVEIEIEN